MGILIKMKSYLALAALTSDLAVALELGLLSKLESSTDLGLLSALGSSVNVLGLLGASAVDAAPGGMDLDNPRYVYFSEPMEQPAAKEACEAAGMTLAKISNVDEWREARNTIVLARIQDVNLDFITQTWIGLETQPPPGEYYYPGWEQTFTW